jgi:hypothetical protein
MLRACTCLFAARRVFMLPSTTPKRIFLFVFLHLLRLPYAPIASHISRVDAAAASHVAVGRRSGIRLSARVSDAGDVRDCW